MMRSATLFLIVLALAMASGAEAGDFALPQAEPASVGLNPQRLARIDRVVAQGISRGNMPGCVVLVGYQGKIVWLKAYGNRSLKPMVAQMTIDTVFDLASLTKPIATATSVMTLVDRGDIASVEDPVVKYLPNFKGHGKEAITIAQLLTHQSGLLPDNSIRDYADGPEKAFDRINALDLRAPIGERFMYSDVGFIVLGRLVEKLSQQSLAEYAKAQIFEPLGMRETGYLPNRQLRERAAVTQQREGDWMRGEVHDPRAFALGGIAGHAGLFSTAKDLAIYANMMVQAGQLGESTILSKATHGLMTAPRKVAGGSLRALGWDVQSGYSSNRGDLLSDGAFGHGGFTGTAMWIDPAQQLFVIFLSNRVHPDGKGSVNLIAGRIATLAAAALRSAEN